jgi:hypothetical protein
MSSDNATPTPVRRKVWMDVETTGLHAARRPWEVALITRDEQRDGLSDDLDWHWFIHARDLDLANADAKALDIGGFWERHPHGPILRTMGGLAYLRGLSDAKLAWELGNLPYGPEARVAAIMADEVFDLTRNRAMIYGSNPNFDMHTVEASMLRIGLRPQWHYHGVDVPTLIEGWLMGKGAPIPTDEHKRSDALCRAIGIEPDNYPRHTAMGDCQLFRDAYDALRGAYVATRLVRRKFGAS